MNYITPIPQTRKNKPRKEQRKHEEKIAKMDQPYRYAFSMIGSITMFNCYNSANHWQKETEKL